MDFSLCPSEMPVEPSESNAQTLLTITADTTTSDVHSKLEQVLSTAYLMHAFLEPHTSLRLTVEVLDD